MVYLSKHIRRLVVGWFSFILLSAGTVNADNYNLPDRIMAVTVPNLQADRDHFDIPLSKTKGQVAPLALSGTWRIFGGTVLTKPPASLEPVLVELHGMVGTDRKLIVRVWVRYYPTNKGWQPLYKLSQEPVVIKTPGGWKPLFDSPVSPELVDILNLQQHPTPAGYRAWLDFKMYRNKVSIDSWVFKKHP
ncbi:MAG: hypothetical protein ACWGOV_11750 [Acidiferrobacterales bacterium]